MQLNDRQLPGPREAECWQARTIKENGPPCPAPAGSTNAGENKPVSEESPGANPVLCLFALLQSPHG